MANKYQPIYGPDGRFTRTNGKTIEIDGDRFPVSFIAAVVDREAYEAMQGKEGPHIEEYNAVIITTMGADIRVRMQSAAEIARSSGLAVVQTPEKEGGGFTAVNPFRVVHVEDDYAERFVTAAHKETHSGLTGIELDILRTVTVGTSAKNLHVILRMHGANLPMSPMQRDMKIRRGYPTLSGKGLDADFSPL